jgi:ketosteroid isomerase-like protein
MSQRADSMPLQRDTYIGFLLLLVTLVACPAPRSTGAEDPVALAALTDTLKARIEEAYDFSRPGAAARMSALYPESGTVVSASGGQLTRSADSLRAGIAAFWRDVGQNMRNPRWEWGTVHVDRLSDEAAVLTATWSIPHIAPTGRPHVIRGAWTAVFRHMGGRWLIVTEHLSVPPA